MKSAARCCMAGLSQDLLQESSVATQEAETAFVGEPPFSDLHAAKAMANPVQLAHGFDRVKLGTALWNLGLGTYGLGPVLYMQQVDLN